MALGMLAALSPPAHAVPLEFNFNSLSDGASNTAVRNYMQGILNAERPGETVAVIGAKGEKNYNGDGYVVGPVANGSVVPETLGTSDKGIHHNGGFDTFIVNNGSDRITIQFSFDVYSVSFDYEIFPDGTCPNWQTCSAANWPDFTFEADDVVMFNKKGIVPGMGGTYPHSPKSGPVNDEKAPQLLALSGEWFFPGGVSKLEFIDWPRMIGIDNLRVNGVPEPGSIVLLGAGLISLGAMRRLRPRKSSR